MECEELFRQIKNCCAVNSVSSLCVSVCIQSIYRLSIEHSDQYETVLQTCYPRHTNKTLESPICSVDMFVAETKWLHSHFEPLQVLINGHLQRNIYNWMHFKSLSRVTVSFHPHTSLLSLSHYFHRKSNIEIAFLFLIKGVNPTLSCT